jgi:excisionase family DNA binding protein
LVTPRSLAAYSAASERTVRQMLADASIPPYLIGGSRRIDPANVHAYVDSCRCKAA